QPIGTCSTAGRSSVSCTFTTHKYAITRHIDSRSSGTSPAGRAWLQSVTGNCTSACCCQCHPAPPAPDCAHTRNPCPTQPAATPTTSQCTTCFCTATRHAARHSRTAYRRAGRCHDYRPYAGRDRHTAQTTRCESRHQPCLRTYTTILMLMVEFHL